MDAFVKDPGPTHLLFFTPCRASTATSAQDSNKTRAALNGASEQT